MRTVTGCPGAGNPADTIKMGRYPKDLATSAFGDWGTREHSVTGLDQAEEDYVKVTSDHGQHLWFVLGAFSGIAENYSEDSPAPGLAGSEFRDSDHAVDVDDSIWTDTASPSEPQGVNVWVHELQPADDVFLDVEILYEP